ncbi:integrase core domain-containing protein, partial [Acinetobacter johnsonii]|uniref:integrase core domain-containing protein n=1 Tax=Acinetobacter johnsonii TaxID=40214 RepID=UPI0032B43436
LKADWQGLADVQLATLNWVDWFNKKRVHSALGYVVNGNLKLTPFTLKTAK